MIKPANQSYYHAKPQTYTEVICICGHRICDDRGIIRARCVKLREGKALCRCKRWVRVPVGWE
ncbi:hypothetical protein [Vibrio sp. SCSIO 43137]|uniref:hypothetical protein n=1 Tax=Vibrio sp. SCSIO 43137 TaxID=3021011 RepID=UPI002307F3CE|nr:hypothetical protein [Vibrio sp. SCSIO 43137]WCE31041.1 hypothetical protein PK654_07190 [Vibrio sp. SCSIO 43137]